MKTPAYLAISTLLLASGCASDAGMIDPTTRSDVTLSSQGYSAWSPPQNLVPVNSTATDQHPALSKDGLSLYFASNRTGDQNIWVAQRDCTDTADEDCDWGAPVMLDNAVNSNSLDAAPTLSRDGHQLFFASQRPNSHCSVTPCDRDLWVSYRSHVHDDFGWQPALNLGSPINTSSEEVAPSYLESEDGLAQLFFNDGTVNQGGILAGGNIYVSHMRPDGIWSNPLLVDDPADDRGVNTTFSDQRPSISHDGRELYFHSNRPTPVGEVGIAHIWVATRERLSDPWSAPTLVPSPISDVQTIHPFIHSHGKAETLLFVRSGDLWISQRTRKSASE